MRGECCLLYKESMGKRKNPLYVECFRQGGGFYVKGEISLGDTWLRRDRQRTCAGVDEQASILLKNAEEEMAAITLSLHAKQPKRGTIAYENAYIEMFEYPRGERARITWTADGRTEEIAAGATADALMYEVLDMEAAVAGERDEMHLDYTIDVMDLMTQIRRSWGMKYPEEE